MRIFEIFVSASTPVCSWCVGFTSCWVVVGALVRVTSARANRRIKVQRKGGRRAQRRCERKKFFQICLNQITLNFNKIRHLFWSCIMHEWVGDYVNFWPSCDSLRSLHFGGHEKKKKKQRKKMKKKMPSQWKSTKSYHLLEFCY